MRVEIIIEKFLNYISIERNLSKNTVISYKNDLERYIKHLKKNHIKLINDVTSETIGSLFDELRSSGLSAKSISRNFSAIRTFTNTL